MHSLKLQEIRGRIEALKNDSSVLSQPGAQRDKELRQLEEWMAELLTIRLDDLEQEGLDFAEVAAATDDMSIILARVAKESRGACVLRGAMADTPTKMPEIVVDHREMRSPVAKTLERLGVKLTFKTLLVGDYVVSDRIAFERKTMDDLFSSWLDEKKLFEQLYDLAQAYHRPVLIIEGGDPFFTTRRVNVQAIRGMLNAITVSLRVPILYSLTAVETAQHLLLVALKEQNKDGRSISVHGKRSHMGIDRQREYIVSAVTDVGPVAAKNLLSYFGSVENVMKASPEELGIVKLIGPITAEHIRKVVSGKYAEGGKIDEEKVQENVSIQQGSEKPAARLWI